MNCTSMRSDFWQLLPFAFGLVFLLAGSAALPATEYDLNGHRFTVPDGFVVEQIAGPPLVDRPVSADFDEKGRLYVTDSSGSNEPLAVQREKRPHRIVRLEDSDGDGVFDKSTVFADKLMFPEGSLWFDGSLYVAAPPEIWKFTDSDDDGVAEKREVWFDGKTLTHCGNDLHGPYLGPDGWMYWCKGAFAEQTYSREGKAPWTTRAAHIFRRRPEGGPLEPVMTGGMDNPVEVVFTPGGERIFTTTFLVHPNQGQRDGLIHAVYGGVYGKDHRAIHGHPRTGDLMPTLAHLGAAAPCGLARLESDGLGKGYRDNVLACSFNMHKITRQQLRRRGATFACEVSDLLVSDNLDFHPTDVLEDADGSVVVVDTGGWFRLCCPTSQLEKADVLGGIYRVRREDARRADDPRGRRIPWPSLDAAGLTGLLSDSRFTVRNQARQRLGRMGDAAVPSLRRVLSSSRDSRLRLQAVWALTWVDSDASRAAVREALADADETVRQAALHSISVRKDKAAVNHLRRIVQGGTPHNRRAAAEALGRVGEAEDVATLLQAVADAVLPASDGTETAVDRFLEHSLIYAAMELDSPDALRRAMSEPNSRVRRAAWIALDQMEGGDELKADDVRDALVSEDAILQDGAWWILEQHADWGDAAADAFREQLRATPGDAAQANQLRDRLARFASAPAVREVVAETLRDQETPESLCLILLEAMASSRQKPLPSPWRTPLRQRLIGSPEIVRGALAVLNQLGDGKLDAETIEQLAPLTGNERLTAEIRLRAMLLTPPSARRWSSALFDFVCQQLSVEAAIGNRALAMDLLATTPLTAPQLEQVAKQLPRVGAMEMRPLMAVFAKSQDPKVGESLVSGLLNAPAATALLPDDLTSVLAGFGDAAANRAKPILVKIEQENRNKVERVEEVLELLPKADVRRGLRVFQSTKASCIACHRRGYIGGNIGPDLNRIGSIRKERDLVESILFPSLSFVRSYEPVAIITKEGKVLQGLIRDETEDLLRIQIDAQRSVDVVKESIEQRQMGRLSIMPAGLEKQLSPQELADLVKYLKEG